MAGMFTRLYMEKYGVTREHLLAISLKNQEMGTRNPTHTLRWHSTAAASLTARTPLSTIQFRLTLCTYMISVR